MLTVTRACVLLAIFAGIAVTVVHLRREQTRCAARIVSTEARWVTLRRELWSLQTRTARLKAPDLLRNRAILFQTGLVPPDQDGTTGHPWRYAFGNPQE